MLDPLGLIEAAVGLRSASRGSQEISEALCRRSRSHIIDFRCSLAKLVVHFICWHAGEGTLGFGALGMDFNVPGMNWESVECLTFYELIGASVWLRGALGGSQEDPRRLTKAYCGINDAKERAPQHPSNPPRGRCLASVRV